MNRQRALSSLSAVAIATGLLFLSLPSATQAQPPIVQPGAPGCTMGGCAWVADGSERKSRPVAIATADSELSARCRFMGSLRESVGLRLRLPIV